MELYNNFPSSESRKLLKGNLPSYYPEAVRTSQMKAYLATVTNYIKEIKKQ